jgi:nucleoside-diphosphate kinase
MNGYATRRRAQRQSETGGKLTTLEFFGCAAKFESHHLRGMAEDKEEDTLVIIKPDSFWRHLGQQVEGRIQALGLIVVAARTLAGGENLSEEKWREFYFPAIGDRPPCLTGTSKYLAYGPVKVIHLRGAGAVRRVRQAVGATRPWQAEPGTIRGDFWPGATEANAPFRLKFQQPGDEQFLFNLIHASDSEPSFNREVRFFPQLTVSRP